MTRGATVTQPANEWLRFLCDVRELLQAVRAADRQACDDMADTGLVTVIDRARWRAVLNQTTTLEDFMR